jgi:hypothetical protein
MARFLRLSGLARQSTGRLRFVTRHVDWLVAALIAVIAALGYHSTIAPTVLDGDAALFQYTPSALGVTYPTGYPTYVLFGFVWKTLVPVGSIAYRMNLLSVVCGALALAILYPALARLLESRAAALCAVAIFGTLPTYWRWATEAKIYTLHILLLSAILFLLSRSEDALTGRTLLALGLLFGLAAANHSTTVLLLPGLLLLLWLSSRDGPQRLDHPLRSLRSLRYLLPAAALPLLLYLYVPLRAEWLLAREGTLSGLNVPVAVARGLVSEYYRPGLNGLVRYFTAADFTGGVVANWASVPHDLGAVYWPLVKDDFGPLGLLLAATGAVTFAVWRPRRFWPLFLMYVVLIPFVLTYGQGEQSAFLLPSSLMLAVFGGSAVAGILRLIRTVDARLVRDRSASNHAGRRPLPMRTAIARWIPTFIVLVGTAYLPLQQASRDVGWLTQKWNDATHEYWTDVLAHPMEKGAAVLAHWGDLTSFWYLQHAEGQRSDLYGLFPPAEPTVAAWLGAGHSLYVAGPLQGRGDDLAARYQLIPWGRLVRVASRGEDARTLLPNLPSVGADVVFGGQLRLLGAGFDGSVPSGGLLPVTLTWQAVQRLPSDVRISLRLVADDGTPAGQSDDTLLSGWLPAGSLPPDQLLLSFHRFKLPAGTMPGIYHLQVSLYQKKGEEWQLADGQMIRELGTLTVSVASLDQPPDPWSEFKPVTDGTFDGEIRLVGYDYSVTRARQGRGFTLHLLWQTIGHPREDYVLLVEMVDDGGKVWRDWRFAPAGGRAPTSTWTVGQTVRDQVPLVLPADAPPGQDTLRVRLGWLRPDGERLPVRRWLLPVGDDITLPGVQVVEQEGRTFEAPPFQQAVGANFDDKALLLGYDLPTAEVSAAQTLPLTLIWHSLTSDMRASYTVFVHLVGADGKIVAQADKEPGRRSKRPTSSWVRHEVVVDPIELTLSPDTLPGTYRLVLGLYLATDGSRLPLRDSSDAVTGDSLHLTDIQVGAP